MAENGSLFVFTDSDGNLPEDWYAAGPDFQDIRRLTDLNPWLKDKALARSELISYRDADGKELRGVLYYPADYDKSKKCPLITEVYERFFDNGFNGNFNIFASAGYAILRPSVNFITGYPGEAWAKGALKRSTRRSRWASPIRTSSASKERATAAMPRSCSSPRQTVSRRPSTIPGKSTWSAFTPRVRGWVSETPTLPRRVRTGWEEPSGNTPNASWPTHPSWLPTGSNPPPVYHRRSGPQCRSAPIPGNLLCAAPTGEKSGLAPLPRRSPRRPQLQRGTTGHV